ESGEHHGFGEELKNDVGLARADGFSNPDFARTLSDRNQHDIHDADSAHQQTDGTQHHHDQRHHRSHVMELFHHLLGGGNKKIVGLVGGDLALDSQDHPRFIDRGSQSS